MRHYVLPRRMVVYAGVLCTLSAQWYILVYIGWYSCIYTRIQAYIYTRMYHWADKATRFEFGTDIGTDTSCVRATNSPQFRRGYCAVSELYGPNMTVFNQRVNIRRKLVLRRVKTGSLLLFLILADSARLRFLMKTRYINPLLLLLLLLLLLIDLRSIR